MYELDTHNYNHEKKNPLPLYFDMYVAYDRESITRI
jgi:hypothetical protein